MPSKARVIYSSVLPFCLSLLDNPTSPMRNSSVAANPPAFRNFCALFLGVLDTRKNNKQQRLLKLAFSESTLAKLHLPSHTQLPCLINFFFKSQHSKTKRPLTPNRSAILEYKQKDVPTSCKGQREERESNVELTVVRMGMSRLFEAPVTSFS